MAIWEPGELEAYKKRYGAPFGLETTSEKPVYPTGLRTQSLEYNPDGTFFGVASDQPAAGLERGLAEYRAGGGLKSRPEYEHAYNQALGEIRPSEGNLMPKSYEEAQAEIQRMIQVGRAKGYRDNDIIADIRERGLDKIQPVQPKYQEVSKGGGLYQLDPGGVNAPKEIVPRGLEEPKEIKAPGTIETAEGVFQWNPESNRFDIPLGKGKGSIKEIRELAKEEKATKKEEARLQMAMTKANLVMGKVDEALGQVGYNTAGLGGAVLGKVPGTSAVDLDETLDTIRANIGFNELAEMRQASPTGGALGQVAVRELELLTSALGSLNRRQSPKQLKSNLDAIKIHYSNWKSAVDEAQLGAAATGGGKTVTVRNPTTGEMETWDLTTEQRVQ